MTREQEKLFREEMTKAMKEQRFQGLKAGAVGILGATLNMINAGKTIDDIKAFCINSLKMDGMKYDDEKVKKLITTLLNGELLEDVFPDNKKRYK